MIDLKYDQVYEISTRVEAETDEFECLRGIIPIVVRDKVSSAYLSKGPNWWSVRLSSELRGFESCWLVIFTISGTTTRLVKNHLQQFIFKFYNKIGNKPILLVSKIPI